MLNHSRPPVMLSTKNLSPPWRVQAHMTNPNWIKTTSILATLQLLIFETRCSWILKETSKNDSLTSPRPAWPVLQCLYLRLPASLNWDLSWAKYKLELRYVALNLAKPLNSMLCQRLGNHCGLVDYVLKPSFELVTCSCCSLNRRHLAAAPSKGHGDESRLNALNIHMWNVFWLRVKSENARTLVAQTCQQSWKKKWG